MAKAVLVIDMPEQTCQKCTLCYETENDDEYLCCATGKLLPDGAKPEWCPLRELPEKKAPDNELALSPMLKGHIYEYERGCNACLDAIDEK